MTKLILVRHGMPDEGHLQRPHDPPLNKTGQRQAIEVAERLAGEGIFRIVSSPQMRAQNTAAPLADRLGLAIETVEGLAEVDRYTDRYPLAGNNPIGEPRALGSISELSRAILWKGRR